MTPTPKPTSPLRQRATKPVATTTPPSAPPPPAAHPLGNKSVQQITDMVSSLLESIPSSISSPSNSKTNATAADIFKALHNDDELFLLTKVLILTRQMKDRAYIEDGLFKLLVAMRPEVDALKAIELLLPPTSKGG
eukprot:TRINITY_DN45032_c0_g1_i1.p1 TRINITY_DN45032_c0_g1~~TRINITY_DN45032_c0_g1_i1.p1  ORF type:complete len:146 (+),score=7.44 TRINITY_DN45032_c0_g1_i1:32-439(+)